MTAWSSLHIDIALLHDIAVCRMACKDAELKILRSDRDVV